MFLVPFPFEIFFPFSNNNNELGMQFRMKYKL